MIAQTLRVCLHCCGARIAPPLLARSRTLRPLPLARLPLPATGSGRLAPSRAVPALGRALRANKKCTPKGAFFVGGEGETRTLAPGLIRPTPLAGAPRHQLEYFSIHQAQACRLQNLHMLLYRISGYLSRAFLKIDKIKILSL